MLVNNAGANWGAPLAEYPDAAWDKVLALNVKAVFHLTRACLPLLASAEHGSVVFMVDDKPGAYWDAYQVSKQALVAMADG